MRIRGAKTEMEEAGLETEGMAESTAKLQAEIKALSGVDIMLDKNTFKSTYQIMEELAAKWEDLTDIQQASVTELIAGKRQGNIVASLMTNFDIAQESLQTSLASEGSAMREHEKWMESLQAKINQLKAAWQGFSQAFMSSDFLKGALDTLINILEVLTKMIDTVGVIPTLLAGVGLFKLGKKGLGSLFGASQTEVDVLLKMAEAMGIVGVNSGKSAGLMNKAGGALKNMVANAGGATGALKSVGGSLLGLAKAHPIALAATVGVTLLAGAYFKAKKDAKELAEEVDKLTAKYQQQHSELIKNKGAFDSTNPDSMASRYAQLSKGVNDLGKNVSLTSDEYEEYKSITNEIAAQIPSLVQGYDAEGNAILNTKGNVEELTRAYEKLIEQQNNKVLKKSGKIEEDFKNVVKENKKTDASGNKLTSKSVESLEKMLNESYSLDQITDAFKKTGVSRKAIGNAIKEAGIDVLDDNGKEIELGLLSSSADYDDYIQRAIQQHPDAIKTIVDDWNSEFDSQAEGMKSLADAALSQAFDISDSKYADMSDEMQSLARSVVNGLDAGFYEDLVNSGTSVETYVNNLLDTFNELGEGDAAKLEAAFDLQTQFNGGEISYGEYVKGIKDVENVIDSLALDEEVKNQIKLALNTEEVKDEYDALKKRLTSEEYDIQMNAEEAEEFLNGLSTSEYAVAVDLIANGDIDFGDFDIDSLRKYIEEQAKLNEAMNFTIAMDVETESIEALNTAMAESVSGAGLSSEAIDALKGRYAELESQGYNLSAMFEETANGIHLNREAVSELEQALASNKLSETDGHLETLKGKYDDLTDKINNCTDAGERASLYSEQQQVAQKINDLATLASQYEGLTSAYKAWQDTESAGSERDMYENVIKGFETMEDELSRGWIDDGSIKFLELLTGKTDLASKSTEDLKKVYDGLDKKINSAGYSVRDFFTVDDDGNSTNTGVYNFLETVEALEKSGKKSSVLDKTFKDIEGIKNLVKRDKDGNIISFDLGIAGGDEAIADALGISEELVQIMLRAADDAGFVVTLDGNYTQLADLKTSAEEANAELKKLGKTDIDFNFGANNLEDLNTELGKSMEVLEQFRNKDGTINMKMEGAEEALEIASYFTATIDKLTEPAYMQLETNQVEKELQEPLTKMQEFERLSKEKHQLKLTGDKKGLKEVNAEMDEIAEFLEGLDEETKIDLDIDGLSQKEIKSKLEKGEIEIPATVDIQMEMSDDIKDMRLLMMNELGLVSDNEVKLKIGYEIDDSLVDRLTDEEKEVVIKYIEENEDVWDKYSKEEREAVVKIIADGTDIESWEAKEKKALVKYVVDGGAVDNWTPEEKQAFAKYLVDGGDVDGWTPEAKDAFVKYLVDGGDPDKFDPEDKESWVVYKKDSKEPDNYQPPKKDQTVTAQLNSSEVDGYNPPSKTLTVKAVLKKTWSSIKQALGIGGVNGTVNADGTTASITTFAQGTTGRAFKQGSWSTKDSGTALMGELGRETIVRDGRFFTVGDTGAGFYQYKKGDIIFNHKQTEELFRNGKVTSGGGRGRALASGTAFSYGTGGGWGKVSGNSVTTTTTTTTTTKTSSSGSSSKSNSSSKKSTKKKSSSKKSSSSDDFEETFDWIEIAIDRIERAIDQLDLKANSIYKKWSTRNSALVDEIGKVEDEIALQQKAYDKYMAAANAVGLSSSYAKKVQEGKIDIQTIKDETLAEKIKDYQEWYEKALDCKDAILELQEAESELYKQRFEHVQAEYDGIPQGYEHTESMLNEYISQAEEKSYIVSKKYYQALVNNEKSNIAELKKEQSALIAARDEAVASGTIKKYSEAWYDMCAEIDAVTEAIEESTTALLEFDNAMREIDWSIFDLIQDRVSNITDEAEFLIELMSSDKLFDDNGKLTDQGKATMGLRGQNYNTNMYQADLVGAEIAKLNKQIEKDPYDQELINRRKELLELQWEFILAAQDEKEAIRDLVEEGIEIELDALQERIDKYNESIEAAKDLYDYQKDVEKQSKNIGSLRKQLSAYEGDNSEEAQAKIQELRVSLSEAEDELKETEYDKYISDQSALLDSLYNEYELILNSRLDNIDALLADVISEVNTSASTISSTLETEADSVGYDLSEEMKNIWNTGDGNIKSVLTTYGGNFSGKLTTVNATLNGIKAGVDTMVANLNKEATAKTTANKTSSSSQKDPTKSTTTSTKTTSTTKNTTTKKSSGDGKAKIGDRVKFVSGKYYYDSYGSRPLGSKNQGKYVYITHINNKGSHPYHISTGKKLGSGDLGWLKLSQLSGYLTGKKKITTGEYAWTQEGRKQEYIVRPSDGAILTPLAKNDSVLNASASNNIWNMANNPAEFIKDSLALDASSVPNNSSVQNSYVQNLDKVVFNLPNVQNYEQLLASMQKDKNFERLILAMSVDRLAGKSALGKNKAIR